ncbi:MAG: sulfotransferase family protein [Sphingomonadales bacterium]
MAGIGLYRGFPDAHAAIFIHIPKSAGVSVKRSLGISGLGHEDYLTFRSASPRKCRDYFKFAFVRNPWDRLLSAYSFLAAGGMPRFDTQLSARLMSGVTGFEHFVLDRLERPDVRDVLHFRPQFSFISDESGVPRMDFVGRLETIDADFAHICERLGLAAPLQRHNVSRHPDYRSAYTPEMHDVAARLYARDIELFGYSFDG